MNREEMSEKEENIVALLTQRYVPYWPLFIGLFLVSLAIAWAYLNFYATYSYEVTATLIIKDENKGVDDSNMMESMNIFNSKKIVENEIEVIQSKGLMKKVVNELKLYAPVYEEKGLRSLLAYTSSPIIVEMKNPQHISNDPDKQKLKFYFSFDSASNIVKLQNTSYPVNKWLKTEQGEMRFLINGNRTKEANDSLFFYLIHPKIITDNLIEDLNVSATDKLSTVVNLSLKDPVPQRGEDILNRLIFAYNQAAILDRNILANNTLAFIEDRIKFVELDLNALEKELQQYKSTKGVVDLSEQGKLYLQSVGENERKIADINLQLTVLDNIENYVVSKKGKTGIVPSTLGINDVVLTQLLEKLYAAEIEYEKLIRTIPKNNPIVVSIVNEIEKIRPSILENIRTHRVNLQASLNKVNSTKEVYNAVLQSIPQKERELLEISRRKAIKHDLYSFLLQKREETALSYAPSISDSRVVDMAESSPLPVSPKPLIVYAIASVLGLGAGLALVTGKEVFSNKVLFRYEIEEHTSIPVIGEIIHFKDQNNSSCHYLNDRLVAEQLKDIRLASGLYGTTVHKQVILVTSSMEGEGKSFVSENFALSLASSGKKVVLVNFDLQKPHAALVFKIDGENGISDYLISGLSTSEIIHATSDKNLFVIPAGNTSDKASTAVLDTDLNSLFSYLRDEFDYIIIDTPPVSVATDAFIVSKYCDMMLYIIRHNYTPKRAIEYLEQNIKLYELKNLAIIFNDINSRGFIGSGYGLNYGFGHKSPKQYKSYQHAA